LSVGKEQPLPQLEESGNPGPLLGMMDGSVRRLKPEKFREAAIFRALTSIDGREIISQDYFDIPRPAPPKPSFDGRRSLTTPPIETPTPTRENVVPDGGMGASMGSPTPNPSIEQRLESIERKLDLLLQQSNARVNPELLPPSTRQ
jgi:hypothetical protein